MILSSEVRDRIKTSIFPRQRCDSFKCFIQEKWMEHKDELWEWERKFPEYNQEYYFRKHRWMLKRMFQDEIRNRKNGQIH